MSNPNLERLRHYPLAEYALEHIRASGPVSAASIRHWLKLQAAGVDERNADDCTGEAIRRLTVFGLIDVYDPEAAEPTYLATT